MSALLADLPGQARGVGPRVEFRASSAGSVFPDAFLLLGMGGLLHRDCSLKVRVTRRVTVAGARLQAS